MLNDEKVRVKVYRDIRDRIKTLPIQREKKERYTYFLSNIYDYIKKAEVTYIHSKHLMAGLGRDYQKDIELLSENKIITRGRHYTPGLKSKDFDFCDSEKISDVKVDMPINLKEKERQKKKITSSSKLEIELNRKNICSVELKNQTEIRTAIQEIPGAKYSNIKDDLIFLRKKIKAKKKRVTKKNEGSRIFHFLTNLPKGLRYLLTVEGEELEERDMSSAHFFFLCQEMAFNYRFKTSKGIAELDKFKKLVISGNLYDFFLEEINKFKKSDLVAKAEVKSNMLTYLYYAPTEYFGVKKNGKKFLRQPVREVFDVMKENFPTIHEFIRGIAGYEIASKLIYRESKSMLSNVASIVNKKYPNLFYFNIHDAIVYKKSDSEIVKKILKEVFKEFRPKFKVEDLHKAFIKYVNKPKLKSKAKKPKIRKMETVFVTVTKDNIFKSAKISRMPRCGDSRSETNKKIKLLRKLKYETPQKMLSKMAYIHAKATLHSSLISLRPKFVKREAQIIILVEN